MIKLRFLQIVFVVIFLSACAEENEIDIVESVGTVQSGVTSPIISNEINGDWTLSFDSLNLQFRVIPHTERVILSGVLGVGSGSARLVLHQNRMTLSMGYIDGSVLVTAELSRGHDTELINFSNIQVLLTYFDGNQFSYPGTISSAPSGDIDYGLDTFVNTFVVNYMSDSGVVSTPGDSTYITNSEGTISDGTGSLIPGASFVSNGNFKWSLIIPVSTNNLLFECSASTYFVYFNCTYLLETSGGVDLETGTAQFSPGGHDFASTVGTYNVYIPGRILPAQLTINSDGNATLSSYGEYFAGSSGTSETGYTEVTFFTVDNELSLQWFIRPGIAPFQGSARLIENLSGIRQPLLAVVIEKL
ncbi:MAG: hypothetical protein ACI845_002530 [Gammaproteobacteria bacterium]|jgi:hypothetical protein